MPPANNTKRQKVFRRFWFALTNFGTTMYYMRTKSGKNKPKNFLQNAGQEFLWRILQHGK